MTAEADERLAEVAQEHADLHGHGHRTVLMEGSGWLCGKCDDDLEAQLRDFADAASRADNPGWGQVRAFEPRPAHAVVVTFWTERGITDDEAAALELAIAAQLEPEQGQWPGTVRGPAFTWRRDP